MPYNALNIDAYIGMRSVQSQLRRDFAHRSYVKNMQRASTTESHQRITIDRTFDNTEKTVTQMKLIATQREQLIIANSGVQVTLGWNIGRGRIIVFYMVMKRMTNPGSYRTFDVLMDEICEIFNWDRTLGDEVFKLKPILESRVHEGVP